MYHIFNRGNNKENLFREERNYPYFLNLFGKHVSPVADVFAYCLLKNHFHFLLRVKPEHEWPAPAAKHKPCHPVREARRRLSNCFNAYAKAINKTYSRTGSLFQEHFQRREIDSDDYALNTLVYIHRNPAKHGFVADFRDWPWSSYALVTDPLPISPHFRAAHSWCGGHSHLAEAHSLAVEGLDRFAALIS
jgi:REP element-mobilizing transposase RayT